MFVKYYYNTPHSQAYFSLRVCKISIPHLKTVNSHIYKTIYLAYTMYQIPYMTICSKYNVITE